MTREEIHAKIDAAWWKVPRRTRNRRLKAKTHGPNARTFAAMQHAKIAQGYGNAMNWEHVYQHFNSWEPPKGSYDPDQTDKHD